MSEEEKKQEEKSQEELMQEFDINKVQFYKKETITDGQAISIDIMTPVTISKSGKMAVDKGMPKQFIGKSAATMGEKPIPFSFIIEDATNEYEATRSFERYSLKTIEDINENIKRMQEMRENEIIVPGGRPQENKIIT